MGVTRGWLPQRSGLPGLNGGGAAAAVPPDDTHRDRQMNTHSDTSTQKLVNIYCEQLAMNNCQPERHTHEHQHRVLTTLHHTMTVQIGFPPPVLFTQHWSSGFFMPTRGPWSRGLLTGMLRWSVSEVWDQFCKRQQTLEDKICGTDVFSQCSLSDSLKHWN